MGLGTISNASFLCVVLCDSTSRELLEQRRRVRFYLMANLGQDGTAQTAVFH